VSAIVGTLLDEVALARSTQPCLVVEATVHGPAICLVGAYLTTSARFAVPELQRRTGHCHRFLTMAVFCLNLSANPEAPTM